MKNFKKIICLLTLTALVVGLTPTVLAYQLPNTIWQHRTNYLNAMNSGDLNGVIYHGQQEMAILDNEPVNQSTNEYKATRTFEIAKAYEQLGVFDKSAEWYEKSLASNIALGYADAVKIANQKIDLYKPELNLYMQTHTPQVFFGAKNEPESGVLWGVTSDSETVSDFPTASATMIYLNFGQEINKYMETFFTDANERGRAIELAVNLANEAGDVLGVPYQEYWLDNLISILNRCTNVPIYLRFAGEVNAWQVQPNPDDFKATFRFVADKIHSQAPHVAVVFGLNFVSDWNGDYEKYYPGDEYVDWVGVSLYLNKYFLGQPAYTEEQKLNENMFFAGASAEPVRIMKKIVETYGNRKPIMVFESGASHHIRTVGEYDQNWAENRLNELVNYMTMVYPQIKIHGYFNTVIPSEHSDYSLTNNDALRRHYNTMISNAPHYRQNTYDNDNAVSYANCSNGFSVDKTVNTLGVYSYAYNSSYKAVTYFVDGNEVAWTDKIPYHASIDFSGYSTGAHTLTVRSISDTGVQIEKSFPFTVNDNIRITVNGTELTGLDQPPTIVNGRTLVPVRAILTALGATVDWNNESKKVTSQKDSTTLELTIGSKTILKNGVPYQSDVASKIINGRTCIPARAAGELFDMNVDWDANTRTVIITNK